MGTLEFVQRTTPKGNTGCLDKAFFATMKYVVVKKAFKQVAEEQTKIKQVKSQLKALGCGREHAGQTADGQTPLDNACQVFDHFEKKDKKI